MKRTHYFAAAGDLPSCLCGRRGRSRSGPGASRPSRRLDGRARRLDDPLRGRPEVTIGALTGATREGGAPVPVRSQDDSSARGTQRSSWTESITQSG